MGCEKGRIPRGENINCRSKMDSQAQSRNRRLKWIFGERRHPMLKLDCLRESRTPRLEVDFSGKTAISLLADLLQSPFGAKLQFTDISLSCLKHNVPSKLFMCDMFESQLGEKLLEETWV